MNIKKQQKRIHKRILLKFFIKGYLYNDYFNDEWEDSDSFFKTRLIRAFCEYFNSEFQ